MMHNRNARSFKKEPTLTEAIRNTPAPPVRHLPVYYERKLTLAVDNGLTGTTKDIPLPEFGEVRIITHGKDIRVETTTKEKVK